jgi:hypothetical protein
MNTINLITKDIGGFSVPILSFAIAIRLTEEVKHLNGGKNMKAYTDIEQSKKLAEILPLESADMKWYFWKSEIDAPKLPSFGYSKNAAENYKSTEAVYLPCWSLAALLGILAEQDFIIKSYARNDGYHYNIDIPSRHCKIWFSSLLDAAVEMVCWLKG